MQDNYESGRAAAETAGPNPNQQTCVEVRMAPADRTTGAGLLALPPTRLTVHAQDFIVYIGVRGYSMADIGVFVTLVGFSAHGPLPDDDKALARIIGARPALVRHARPLIDEYFIRAGDALILSDASPIQAKPESTGRVSLRGVRSDLVAIWGHQCAYCGVGDVNLAIEHITPLARGGSNDITNLTLACRSCNSRKATKTAAEFGHPHIHERAAIQ